MSGTAVGSAAHRRATRRRVLRTLTRASGAASLIVATLLFAGCLPVASGPTGEPAGTNPPGEPDQPSEEAIARNDFQIEVDGAVLRGECRGAREPGAPAVILLSGLGNPASQLSAVRTGLGDELQVCTYDRAGVGASDPPAGVTTFQTATDGLDAVLVGAGISPPYVLVGHSLGGAIALRYTQQHPDEVMGFVAMNPVPPATSYEKRAAAVETPEELQTIEVDFYNGMNDERMNLRSTDLILEEPFPDTVPYVVMYAEDCPGDFCDRIRPILAAATHELARLGDGRFVSVEGAGHEIFRTHLDEVLDQIRSVLNRPG